MDLGGSGRTFYDPNQPATPNRVQALIDRDLAHHEVPFAFEFGPVSRMNTTYGTAAQFDMPMIGAITATLYIVLEGQVSGGATSPVVGTIRLNGGTEVTIDDTTHASYAEFLVSGPAQLTANLIEFKIDNVSNQIDLRSLDSMTYWVDAT